MRSVPQRPGWRAWTLAAMMAAALGTARAEEPNGLRPEVARPLQAAQDLIKGGRAAEALARIREAEALAGRTPYEVFTTERMKGSAALLAGDHATALKAFEAVIASGRLAGAEALGVLQALAGLALRTGQPQAAVTWARRYVAEGGQDANLRLTLVQALYASDDVAGTVKELLPMIAADEAAGVTPREESLKLLAFCQNKLSDEAGYRQTLERLLTHHPRPAYWGDLLARVQRQPGFADRLLLDAFRLMRQTGSLSSAEEYLDMAQLATLAGLPGEALAVTEEGYAKGLLGQGSAAERHQRLRDKVRKLAADDQATLAGSDTQSRAARDGGALVVLGQAAIGHGQTEQGLAWMAQGLAKGVQRHPDDARLRYGAALLQNGRRAQAEPVLRGLTAADGTADLARLWLLAIR